MCEGSVSISPAVIIEQHLAATQEAETKHVTSSSGGTLCKGDDVFMSVQV